MAKLLRRSALRMNDETLDQSVETLIAFYKSEQFAAHTYEVALGHCNDPTLCRELERLRNSHRGRALILEERVREFGGDTDLDADEPWGAFAAAFRRVVIAGSDSERLDALREGESWGVRDYEIDLEEVEPHLRHEIERILLAEQRRTRGEIRRLADASHRGGHGQHAH